jgi:hypothetical protein
MQLGNRIAQLQAAGLPPQQRLGDKKKPDFPYPVTASDVCGGTSDSPIDPRKMFEGDTADAIQRRLGSHSEPFPFNGKRLEANGTQLVHLSLAELIHQPRPAEETALLTETMEASRSLPIVHCEPTVAVGTVPPPPSPAKQVEDDNDEEESSSQDNDDDNNIIDNHSSVDEQDSVDQASDVGDDNFDGDAAEMLSSSEDDDDSEECDTSSSGSSSEDDDNDNDSDDDGGDEPIVAKKPRSRKAQRLDEPVVLISGSDEEVSRMDANFVMPEQDILPFVPINGDAYHARLAAVVCARNCAKQFEPAGAAATKKKQHGEPTVGEIVAALLDTKRSFAFITRSAAQCPYKEGRCAITGNRIEDDNYVNLRILELGGAGRALVAGKIVDIHVARLLEIFWMIVRPAFAEQRVRAKCTLVFAQKADERATQPYAEINAHFMSVLSNMKQ